MELNGDGEFVKAVTENGWIFNFKFHKLLQLHIRGVVRHVGMSFVANFLEHTVVKEF